MSLHSKKTSLLILGITAIACSRVMFWFFNDSEGPNLLIVTVMALIIYFLSLFTVRLFDRSKDVNLKKLLLIILIQILIVTTFYFCLS